MTRLLSDFVCSRVRNHAATLQADARVAYLRRMAFGYRIWVWMATLLSVCSLGSAIFTAVSRVGIAQKLGYVVLFLGFAVVFAIVSRCYVAAFRYTSHEAAREV